MLVVDPRRGCFSVDFELLLFLICKQSKKVTRAGPTARTKKLKSGLGRPCGGNCAWQGAPAQLEKYPQKKSLTNGGECGHLASPAERERKRGERGEEKKFVVEKVLTETTL